MGSRFRPGSIIYFIYVRDRVARTEYGSMGILWLQTSGDQMSKRRITRVVVCAAILLALVAGWMAGAWVRSRVVVFEDDSWCVTQYADQDYPCIVDGCLPGGLCED